MGRDYGRNSVFVYGLRYRTFEGNHIVVEGLDLPYQFDAVNEENRNGHVLFPEYFEKVILAGSLRRSLV